VEEEALLCVFGLLELKAIAADFRRTLYGQAREVDEELVATEGAFVVRETAGDVAERYRVAVVLF
jgi:hypothetical protein